MNTKNNRRAQETRERIIQAVFEIIEQQHKQISKVTVREICEAANVNRSTFYAHFADVYDVLESVERTMSEGIMDTGLAAIDISGDLRATFEAVLQFVYEHRSFYRVYFEEINKMGVISAAWDRLSERGVTFAADVENIYNGAVYLNGATALLRTWIQRDCAETPGELYDMLTRFIRTLNSAFDAGVVAQ